MAPFSLLPSVEVNELTEDVRDIFEELAGSLRAEQRAQTGECHPALDVFETDEAVEIVMDVAGKSLSIVHVDGPQGVRGRNSDNTRLREVLGWEPGIKLDEGLAETYRWIEKQVTGR